MISPKVRATLSTYRGQPLIASNVCAHCGAVDDPESAKRWELDADGDRMCRACSEQNAEKPPLP
jgi:hypothetical protein